MIAYALEALVNGGITDICVMLNGKNPDLIRDFLQDGSEYGCRIDYIYHREVLAGPVRHFVSAKDWAAGEDVVVMLGDSFFRFPLDFRNVTAPHMWTMPLDGMDDPRKYAQVKVDGNRVAELAEKPETVFSEVIATGCWVFPGSVFERARLLCSRKHCCRSASSGCACEKVEEKILTYTRRRF